MRILLDHDSHQMTAHYARLHDHTIRQHWERARKVNSKGQQVTLDPAGPLAEASWMQHRLGLATRHCPTAIADCQCSRPAPMPTPA